VGLKTRVIKGDTISVPSGPSLLESLWSELLKEWTDPDSESIGNKSSYAYGAGYCVGLAYAIGKIERPYMNAADRIEWVLDEARSRLSGG
jgi:hypothetical protein